MAVRRQENIEWEKTVDGNTLRCAIGPRDCLIIVSNENLQGPDIVQRREYKLKQEDSKELDRLDLPPEFVSWEDDASIMMARYGTVDGFTIVNVKRHNKTPLTGKCILAEIKGLMDAADGGLSVHYFGAGKRDTGDWCFEDGFITFEDMVKLYCKHFMGRIFNIYSDCSYSGAWVRKFTEFLDKRGVQPCGHSANEKNMLIKVKTSCKPSEIPFRLLYSLKGRTNDKNNENAMLKDNRTELAEGQHIYYVDPTLIRCDTKSIKDPCTIAPHLTWQLTLMGSKVQQVKVKERGRTAWYFVEMDDDYDIREKFYEQVNSAAGVHYNDPRILKGFWDEPTKQDREEIEEEYGPIVTPL